MGFDVNKFSNAKFKDRTADVPVPELKKFFDEDEDKLIWTVKGIGANEIAVANTAMQTNKDIAGIVSALSSTNSTEKIEAIQEAMGLQSGNVPDDIVRRISLLVSGCVEPEVDQEVAVKLSVAYSAVFYRLTNKILSLTGEGMEPGE